MEPLFSLPLWANADMVVGFITRSRLAMWLQQVPACKLRFGVLEQCCTLSKEVSSKRVTLTARMILRPRCTFKEGQKSCEGFWSTGLKGEWLWELGLFSLKKRSSEETSLLSTVT